MCWLFSRSLTTDKCSQVEIVPVERFPLRGSGIVGSREHGEQIKVMVQLQIGTTLLDHLAKEWLVLVKLLCHAGVLLSHSREQKHQRTMSSLVALLKNTLRILCF